MGRVKVPSSRVITQETKLLLINWPIYIVISKQYDGSYRAREFASRLFFETSCNVVHEITDT